MFNTQSQMLNVRLRQAVRFKTGCHRQPGGFTLAELLVALMVGAIILGAAAAMADAMANGKAATEKMTRSSNYLAQVQTRLADLVMRAASVDAIADGVKLTYSDGGTVDLYRDDTQRIVVRDGSTTSYMRDAAQDNVHIERIDSRRVVITFDWIEDGAIQTYMMTATCRGGS